MNAKHFIIALSVLGFLLGSCSEIEYHEIEAPAYLRVFNNLNYEVRLENRHEKVPYLTMLIDPVYDENGVPISAAIVGDFLDKREKYASPYPTHSAGSTKRNNPEYPGKENVLVGPILNGFDLSSWAQIPAGKHKIAFYFRPINEIPFFELAPDQRHSIAVEREIDLTEREIYTLHVVQKDHTTKENGIILRQENFHKQPFSDSFVYVNFYNMSAKGYFESEDQYKPANVLSPTLSHGINDVTNVYLSLYPETSKQYNEEAAFPAFYAKYLYTLHRDTETDKVHPYFSFPLFADTTKTITTNMVQHLAFLAPGIDFFDIGGGEYAPEKGCTNLAFYDNGLAESLPNLGPVDTDSYTMLPGMIVNIHSGIHNPRSFATVNTVEIVNGQAYLTTIQRKYAPPIY